MLVDGRVTVNGRPARRLNLALRASDQVAVSDDSARHKTIRRPTAWPYGWKIVFEDADLLVVDKPAGLLSSTVPREKRPTLLAQVRDYAKQSDPSARIGLIHRLDRDAAGLLVFSKNDAAFRSLKQQFFRHTVERVYIAQVHGIPKPRRARIETRLTELPDGSIRSTTAPGRGEQAVTHYEVVQRGPISTVRVTLETGRKHQIRVHLSERGWPIVGDPVYGKQSDPGPLQLVAVHLGLIHPRTDKQVEFDREPKIK